MTREQDEERLADTLARWAHNSDAARVTVKLGGLRALMARAEAAEERVDNLLADLELARAQQYLAEVRMKELEQQLSEEWELLDNAEFRECRARVKELEDDLEQAAYLYGNHLASMETRAEAAEAERDNLLRILRDGNAGAAAVFDGYVQEHQRWSERVEAAEAERDRLEDADRDATDMRYQRDAAEAEAKRLREALELVNPTLQKVFGKETGDLLSMLIALRTEIENLRAALLGYIRNENGCSPVTPYHATHCTGWDAEKCGCAVEARAALTGENP